MSTPNVQCGLCLVEKNPLDGGYTHFSSTTGRAWCGTCNYHLRSQIYIWLYNKDVDIDVTPKQVLVPKTAPIHRPDWDTYYLGIAKAVSARGDCVRAQHGAVVVKNHKIVATGYNGAPSGSPNSCGKTGDCPRNHDPNAIHSEGQYDLCWATHAEANALMRASWEEMQEATIYLTGKPCPGCMKLINSAGIARIVTP